MHPQDILFYGHRFYLRSLERVPAAEVYRQGACGIWSTKDLVAHIGSFETVLVEILGNLLEPGPTPLLEAYARPDFNDSQVNARQEMSYDEVLAEYVQAYEKAHALAGRIEPARWRESGLLAWYGAEYDLEDFIVYTYYGHKREHGGQIQVFSDQFG